MLDDASHFFQNYQGLRLSDSDFFICFPVFVLNIATRHKQTYIGHPFRELYDIAKAKDVRELHEVQAELEISDCSAARKDSAQDFKGSQRSHGIPTCSKTVFFR